MRRINPLVLSWAGALLIPGVIALAAEPKVEEQVLGPANSGGVYAISPQGAHAAFAGAKGSRVVVTVDGVEGPVFDELFNPVGQGFFNPQKTSILPATPGGYNSSTVTPVIYSANGLHYAYAGRQGNEYVVIHDGKEVARGPRPLLALQYGNLTLSPGGKFVYWDEMQMQGARGSWRLMMNGTPGPWAGHQTMAPVFSPDDTRYAFTAVSTEDSAKQVFIVDGKDAGYVGSQPVFTADNKLLLSIGNAGGKSQLLVNGKSVHSSIQVGKIIPAPVGSRYAALVRTKVEAGVGVDSLLLDGSEVPGTDGAQTVAFSPDGKHYAVNCMNGAARSMFMVIDGKKGNEYQSVPDTTVFWAPDSSRAIYMATSAGRSFLIVDGQETPVTNVVGYTPIAMPESGHRYAFATRDGNNRDFSLVLDGKPVLPAGASVVDNTLIFSPDSSRFGFFFGTIGGRADALTLFLDGAVQKDVMPAYFGRWVTRDLVPPSIVFSRDGKHEAHLAHFADQKLSGLYVDGKFVYASTRAVYFPSFTPDSRHLLWIADEVAKAPGQPPSIVVYADGAPVVRANGYAFRETVAWSMGSDGVAAYLAADGDTMKRYRITPAPDSDVLSMVSNAEANRVRAAAAADEAAKKSAADAAAAKAKADADAAAKNAKAKADAEAAAAKRKADYDVAVAAKQQARQTALDAQRLKALNTQRARQGLPPLDALPK